MIPSILSRLVILLFGTLYPAYSSYKAVRTKNVKEYVKWMMYWIVYALFTCAETFTDLFLSFWFPFYYEFKIILVVYLLSPATNGSSILYRKFVHPVLTKKEQEIDECIAKAMEQGYHTMLNLGSRSVAYATSIIMQTAIRGGGGLVNHIRKSYSLDDINRHDSRIRKSESMDDVDGPVEEERVKHRRRRTYSPRRTISTDSHSDMFYNYDHYKRSSIPIDQDIICQIRSSEDISSGYSSTEPLYSGANHGSKDNLMRTASLGPAARTRARGLAKKQTSEEDSGSSTKEPDESQCETADNPFSIPFPPSGNFIAPFVKPEYKYLFASLTQQQLITFINNANCAPQIEEVAPRMTSPSAVLKSIVNDDSDGRSGKYHKLPAPDPPCEPADEEQKFETPGSSPVSEKIEVPPVVVKESTPEPVPEAPVTVKEVRKKGRSKESHISKMLHLSKLQFPFWKEKSGKHSPSGSVSGLSRNDSQVSLTRKDSFISLKGDETGEEHSLKSETTSVKSVNLREMSQSPSSKRRTVPSD